jgi:hypothetical protein
VGDECNVVEKRVRVSVRVSDEGERIVITEQRYKET